MPQPDKRVQIQSSTWWAEPWLPKFLEQLERLDYPRNLLRYAFITAPCPKKDRTMEILFDWLRDKENFYLVHVKGPESKEQESEKLESGVRRRVWLSANLGRKYATTKMEGFPQPDFVFICDCDVIKMPRDALRRLVELDVDVVAPYVYVDPENKPTNPWRNKRAFYDTWGFRFLHGPHKGFQHPKTYAPWYARNIQNPRVKADLDKGLIPMMSVGANPVLVKREVLEECWYEGDEAIVGFCNLARGKGFKIWSYPAIEVIHSWRSILFR